LSASARPEEPVTTKRERKEAKRISVAAEAGGGRARELGRHERSMGVDCNL